VAFVDDQDRGAASFGLLGGEQFGGLRGERGGALGRAAAKGGDDGVVDAAGADGRVGQVDEGVPGVVEPGEGGAAATVLPAPTSPVSTPRALSATHQVIRATASPWEACRCSMPGARSRPKGMRVNP